MNNYLRDARTALDRPQRMGGTPRPEDILEGIRKAIESMLNYLEELDRRQVSDMQHIACKKNTVL
jgi:hypothetical protein